MSVGGGAAIRSDRRSDAAGVACCVWPTTSIVLLLTMHHIASDGWSLRVLWRELERLYDAFAAVRSPDLPDLPVQYADYAVWQRSELQGRRLEQLLQYWREQLAGRQRAGIADRSPASSRAHLSGRSSIVSSCQEELVDQLKSLGQAEGVTLHMTLLAAFQVLLARYSGQDDIAVGTPIAGRNHAELEDLIGFFVNTLVLRTDLSGDPTFRELLGRVRQVSLAAYDHQDLPFEKLVEELAAGATPQSQPAGPGAVPAAELFGRGPGVTGP